MLISNFCSLWQCLQIFTQFLESRYQTYFLTMEFPLHLARINRTVVNSSCWCLIITWKNAIKILILCKMYLFLIYCMVTLIFVRNYLKVFLYIYKCEERHMESLSKFSFIYKTIKKKAYMYMYMCLSFR